MPRNIGGTLLKLFFLSLVVGIVLSVLDVEPESLLGAVGGTAESIFDALVAALEWAVPFVLIGAVVVVPIWIILAALRYARRR
ncbi:MAG: hypothetical protein JJ899_06615 [Alphaproteobacteria bacterium]|nr:hypothetical protein [Alphaproteobacteria bacterium]